MRYASEDLREEHEGILAGLDILERMADMSSGDSAPGSAELAEMLDFFRLFADKCHHGKEEAMYFPALREAGINEGVPKLLREHQEGRDRIARMDAALAQGEAGRGGFAQTAHEYAHTLRHHIHDEDTRVFPEGDRALPPQAQADLLERFARFEEEVIGGGTHERLHAMLDRFQQKFGKEGHAGHGHDAHSHGTHHPHA